MNRNLTVEDPLANREVAIVITLAAGEQPREEQGLMTNAQVAVIAAQYAYDFCLKRRLRQYATYFTLEPPAANSRLITAGDIEKWWHCPILALRG
ncbi:MAG: hypothetical protein ACRDHL_07075 [Candidatus Promineifilaceae bacterium]